jgi:hypothetical protein
LVRDVHEDFLFLWTSYSRRQITTSHRVLQVSSHVAHGHTLFRDVPALALTEINANLNGELVAAAAWRCSPRSALPHLASRFADCPTKQLDERASRWQIGKAPAKIDFIFFANLPSVPHSYLSQRVKSDNPTA